MDRAPSLLSSGAAGSSPAGRAICRSRPLSTAHSSYGNLCVTIEMVTVLEFLDREGSSPFATWFGGLDAAAAAKVTTAVRRIGAWELLERQRCRSRRLRIPHRFRAWVPRVLRQGRRSRGHLPRRRDQEAAGPRHRDCARAMERLQEAKVRGRNDNAADARVQGNGASAHPDGPQVPQRSCCGKASSVFWLATSTPGKAILRDYINATIGFEELSRRTTAAGEEPDAHARPKRQSASRGISSR